MREPTATERDQCVALLALVGQGVGGASGATAPIRDFCRGFESFTLESAAEVSK